MVSPRPSRVIRSPAVVAAEKPGTAKPGRDDQAVRHPVGLLVGLGTEFAYDTEGRADRVRRTAPAMRTTAVTRKGMGDSGVLVSSWGGVSAHRMADATARRRTGVPRAVVLRRLRRVRRGGRHGGA